MVESIKKAEELRLPDGLNYGDVPGLSNEIRMRLSEVRPETLGQAGRIYGVTPAATANLLIYLAMERKKGRRTPEDEAICASQG